MATNDENNLATENTEKKDFITQNNALGNDGLSKVISDAWHNTKVIWVIYKPMVQLLISINDLFMKYVEVFKTLSKESDISSPAALLARAYGCYLASVRLSTSGQLSESSVMFRACIETALYGYYINRKPELSKIWTERHKNLETKKKVRNEFKIDNILKELAGQEPKISSWIKNEYEKTIDFGGHPNVYSVAINWRDTGENEVIDIFNNDPYNQKNFLLTNICFGLSCLSVFRLIYPQQLEEIGVPKELKELFDKLKELSQSVIEK